LLDSRVQMRWTSRSRSVSCVSCSGQRVR
jgi:hypothetical protein